MDPLSTARLTDLAERKLNLLIQLRELSLDQTLMADERRSDELLALLSRKSQLIELLQGIQDELKPFQMQAADERTWPTQAERDHCRSILGSSEKLIAEILVIDHQTLNEMTSQRELVGQQLSQFTHAEAILEAYSSSHGNPDLPNEQFLSLDG